MKLLTLKDRLVEMHDRNLVKINHSVMELISAMHLVVSGFDVEVETGFVPPEHATDPSTYLKARIASKIVRYSGFSNKFIIASTPYYIMQIPPALTKPPRFRTEEEISSIKGLCDLYYTSPPVSLEEIRNARLHSIYTLDVDRVVVREWEVNEYLGKAAVWSL